MSTTMFLVNTVVRDLLDTGVLHLVVGFGVPLFWGSVIAGLARVLKWTS
jgi:hypothetical protein